MKKALILAAIATLAFSSITFAANKDNASGGGSIELTGLTLNTSPGVNARYITEATTANEQWFAISTYHGGGEKIYVTSQNQTSVWKQNRLTTDTFASVDLPATEDEAASNSWYSEAGWTR